MNGNNNGSNDFEIIRKKANIVEIVSEYVKLESHGKNFFGVCPFHDDHSPSMSVSKEKQIYKCFVCGATGNVFDFLQNYLHISFLESVKIVADKVGVAFNIHTKKEDTVNKKYYDMMELSTLFYQNNLRTKFGEEARSYLHKRGITDEIIKDFSIGLSLKENDMLYKLLKSKNISNKDMQELGLIAESERGIYDLFRNRIIFPLKSPDGKVNGFSGRIYNSESNSKYINTKETIIFKKRENLYNYHLASNYARQEKFIVICEGFMDAIRIYSNGVKNVVATMGTALAKEQVMLLKKLNVKVIICMDNDNAGELATVSIAKELLDNEIDIGIVRLTGKKDPDEYIIAYGIDAFKENLKNPMTYPEFMEAYFKKNKNLKDAMQLTKFIDDMIQMITATNNELLIEITLNRLAEEYHLDKELLKARAKSSDVNTLLEAKEDKKDVKVSVKRQTRFDRALEEVIYYMMNDTDCIKLYIKENLNLPKSKYRLVINNLLYYFEINREIDFTNYLSFAEDYDEVSYVVREIIKKVHVNSFKTDDMLIPLKIIKNELNEIKRIEKRKSLIGELDVNQRHVIMREYSELKKGSVE